MQQPVPRGRRRRSFRIGGGESPQIRNAGEPHIRPLRQHACRHSAHASLKAVRKGHGLVGMARLGAVPNQLNPLRLHLEVATIDHPVVIEIRKGTGPRRRGSSEEGAVRRQHPTEELLAFLHRTQREIVLHPVLEIADVEHAGAPAARLHHIGATKRVEAKAGDVLHQRLAGPERHLKSGSHLQSRLRRVDRHRHATKGHLHRHRQPATGHVAQRQAAKGIEAHPNPAEGERSNAHSPQSHRAQRQATNAHRSERHSSNGHQQSHRDVAERDPPHCRPTPPHSTAQAHRNPRNSEESAWGFPFKAAAFRRNRATLEGLLGAQLGPPPVERHGHPADAKGERQGTHQRPREGLGPVRRCPGLGRLDGDNEGHRHQQHHAGGHLKRPDKEMTFAVGFGPIVSRPESQIAPDQSDQRPGQQGQKADGGRPLGRRRTLGHERGTAGERGGPRGFGADTGQGGEHRCREHRAGNRPRQDALDGAIHLVPQQRASPRQPLPDRLLGQLQVLGNPLHGVSFTIKQDQGFAIRLRQALQRGPHRRRLLARHRRLKGRRSLHGGGFQDGFILGPIRRLAGGTTAGVVGQIAGDAAEPPAEPIGFGQLGQVPPRRHEGFLCQILAAPEIAAGIVGNGTNQRLIARHQGPKGGAITRMRPLHQDTVRRDLGLR